MLTRDSCPLIPDNTSCKHRRSSATAVPHDIMNQTDQTGKEIAEVTAVCILTSKS